MRVMAIEGRLTHCIEVVIIDTSDGDGGQAHRPSSSSDEAGGQLTGVLPRSCDQDALA